MNLAAAFLLGLAGSLHCAAMCGPLILALQTARRQTAARAPGFLQPAAYHTGRVAVYSLLGALSGLAGAALAWAGFQRWLSIAAGALVLAATLLPWRPPFVLQAIGLIKSRFGSLLRRPGIASDIFLGALNGLLPCGLVYAACAAAASSGTALNGALTMLVFGLGTMPVLLILALGGSILTLARHIKIQRLVVLGGALAGILLIVRGLSLGIPYLSPQLSDGQARSCCHRAF